MSPIRPGQLTQAHARAVGHNRAERSAGAAAGSRWRPAPGASAVAAASGLRVLTPAGTPARRRGARQACGEGASPAGGTLRAEQTPGRRWTDGRLAAKTVPEMQTRHEENKTVRARRARPLPRTRGHAQCTPRSRSLATHSRVRPATGTRTHTRSRVLTRGVPRGRCGCGSSTRRYMQNTPASETHPQTGSPLSTAPAPRSVDLCTPQFIECATFGRKCFHITSSFIM